MPTAYKSFRYKAKTIWTSGRRGLLSAVEKPNVVVGSPPEFKGEPDVWTPEELLIGSVNTCIMLTFLSLAQARGLTPAAYESDAEGQLENVEGKFRITEVTVRPHITINEEDDLDRAREIIERAETECFISNSVKSKVKIVAEFSLLRRNENTYRRLHGRGLAADCHDRSREAQDGRDRRCGELEGGEVAGDA